VSGGNGQVLVPDLAQSWAGGHPEKAALGIKAGANPDEAAAGGCLLASHPVAEQVPLLEGGSRQRLMASTTSLTLT